MNVTLELIKENGSVSSEDRILSFAFEKNAYIPYTRLSVSFISGELFFTSVAEIKLIIDGKTVHHGLIDTIKSRQHDSRIIVRLVSKGFTSLLCRNQIEPGLKTGISLNSLMDSFYTIPYVTHEDNSDVSNYIYVRKNTSMWDAVSNLSYKLLGTYPYIRDENRVMITPYPTPSEFTYEISERMAVGYEYDYTRMASNYHMADINGEYGHYELQDNDVLDKKIVRHEYSDLDMRFLYSPQTALEYRNKFDTRGKMAVYCEYIGYRGEDLFDIMRFSSSSYGRIKSMRITGNSKGVFTKVMRYTDKFL